MPPKGRVLIFRPLAQAWQAGEAARVASREAAPPRHARSAGAAERDSYDVRQRMMYERQQIMYARSLFDVYAPAN